MYFCTADYDVPLFLNFFWKKCSPEDSTCIHVKYFKNSLQKDKWASKDVEIFDENPGQYFSHNQ